MDKEYQREEDENKRFEEMVEKREAETFANIDKNITPAMKAKREADIVAINKANNYDGGDDN